ncbi:hypothetical protein CK227_20540 [Mesorhizobium sp. WSM4308]|uniref:hypothetical protein n=1 Tax=Mesorhizobium sp. WSM4308 TaxID=2029409 RepID=UPI000BAFCB69|nr:hypothetical protein [Mesorhizobium sp. WSM4308]PBB73837.1 hypothetical protein CK227_20540 [Mesorhizobium sp. WSM4308]
MTIERIEKELREALELLSSWPDEKPAAHFRVLSKFTVGDFRTLLTEIERLREALKPFTEACPSLFNDWCPDETPAWWVDGVEPGDERASPITVGDFRNASRALSDKDGGDHG